MQSLNVVEEIYSRNSHREKVPFRRLRKPLSLSKSLKKIKGTGQTGIISEFKRKSPSGFINSKSVEIEAYFQKLSKQKNIAGFSILTEPDHFNGSYDDITAVQHFNIPILDKDFISTREMVDNAYNSGADAILLILDFLEENLVYLLADYAANLGMESLIEFHKIELASRIRPGEGRLFGYNRRNLITLELEPQEETLHNFLPVMGQGLILESGINSEYVRTHNMSEYLGMLIGASILEGGNLQELSQKKP